MRKVPGILEHWETLVFLVFFGLVRFGKEKVVLVNAMLWVRFFFFFFIYLSFPG